MAKSKEPVVIKKYANRRLYNTATSTYAAAMEEQVRRNMEMFHRAFAIFTPFARGEAQTAEAEKLAGWRNRRCSRAQKRLDHLTATNG